MTETNSITIQAAPTGEERSFHFSVLIDGDSIQEAHNVIEVNWDFGDGNESESFEETHTYATSGEYNVAVEVIFSDPKPDGQGGSGGGNPPPPPGSGNRTISIF